MQRTLVSKYGIIICLILMFAALAIPVSAYDQWSNTSSLLLLNGTQNSTTITDEKGLTWTRGGDFQINTSAFKFGGASGFWKKGASSFISTPGSVAFEYDKSNVTIDFFINASTGQGANTRLYSISTDTFSLELVTDQLNIYTITLGAHTVLNTVDVADGTWHHVAFFHNATHMKAAVDGVWGTPVAYTTSLGSPTDTVYIGRYFSGAFPAQDYNGMLDHYRISKWDVFGLNTFTPPTSEYGYVPPAPVANFTVTPDNGMYGSTFQFNDTSTGPPTMWNTSIKNNGLGTTIWYNGTTLSFQNLSWVPYTGGNYTIQLWAQNAAGGNYSAKQQFIDVWNWSPATMSGTPRSGANPLTVTFTGSSNNATSYYWEFGDTGTSAIQSPTHQYTSIGSYTVNYGTTNTHHSYNWSNNSGYITVNATLAADFSGAPLTGYMNPDFPVAFVDMSTGADLYYWYWEFGDTVTSLLRNPSHTYTAPGSYKINLTVKGADGTTNLTKNNYVVISPMGASFTANITSGSPPLAVQFTDTSDGYPASWCWTFGDGDWSNDQNPVHTYLIDGLWDVFLHTNTTYESGWSNVTGCINTITPPTEGLTANQTIGVSPLAVQFNVTSSGGVPTMWNYSYIDVDGVTEVWFFNTSNIAERNATHTFTNVGIYNVTLTATNAGGYSTSGVDITVIGTVTVDWTSYVITGLCPLAMQFLDYSGNATSYLWDFGDGNTSTLRQPNHTYEIIGSFNVNFTALNAYSSASLVRNNYVTTYICTGGGTATPTPTPTPTPTSAFNAPIARFVANITTGSNPLAVQFYDLSIFNATIWAWTFGDGSNDVVQNPQHTYTTNGQFTVTLIATNAYGTDTVTKSNYITVSESLYSVNGVNFVGVPRVGTIPLVVGFTDVSNVPYRNITEWNWSFGDGNYSTLQNPLNTYIFAGCYNVILTVNTTNLINNSFLNNTKMNYICAVVPSTPAVQTTGIPMLPAAPKQLPPVQWVSDWMLWVVIALLIAVGWLVIRRR